MRCRGPGLEPSQIFFITGADAFADIETWSRYPEVLDLAHFVVVVARRAPVGALRHVARLEGPDAAAARDPDLRVDGKPESISGGCADARRLLYRDPPSRLAASRIDASVPGGRAHIQQHGFYRDVPHSTRADHLHGETEERKRCRHRKDETPPKKLPAEGARRRCAPRSTRRPLDVVVLDLRRRRRSPTFRHVLRAPTSGR